MQVGILAASLATSSYAFFGNVAGSMTGVPPLVNDKLGKTNFSSAQKVRAWTLHFHHAHVSSLNYGFLYHFYPIIDLLSTC